ncbi:MAG: PEP-CTERM sorting domain-containing protein [Pseudomonadota bacterium]
MNKIKQILIGAGMIALSGNAAAIMISVGDTEYTNFKSLRPVIQDILGDDMTFTGQDAIYQARIEKKLNRFNNKGLKIKALRAAGGRSAKIKRLKVQRRSLKKGMMRNVARMDLAGLSGSISNLEAIIPNGEPENVPEPSTIALLGLGLVGIGAARRLRKKAR